MRRRGEEREKGRKRTRESYLKVGIKKEVEKAKNEKRNREMKNNNEEIKKRREGSKQVMSRRRRRGRKR